LFLFAILGSFHTQPSQCPPLLSSTGPSCLHQNPISLAGSQSLPAHSQIQFTLAPPGYTASQISSAHYHCTHPYFLQPHARFQTPPGEFQTLHTRHRLLNSYNQPPPNSLHMSSHSPQTSYYEYYSYPHTQHLSLSTQHQPSTNDYQSASQQDLFMSIQETGEQAL